MTHRRSPPLRGLRVIELASARAVSFCAMQLAGLRTQVLRIQQSDPGESDAARARRAEVTQPGRTVLGPDLASKAGMVALLDRIAQADVLPKPRFVSLEKTAYAA